MIHIICALDCEAAPLLSRYKMKHDAQTHSLKTYLNKQGTISLSISGVGKDKSASCIEKAAAYYFTSKYDVWLNIGVAGHKTITIGEIRFAHSILDTETENVWYPQILTNDLITSADLITLSKPSVAYVDAMFDMESAGFYTSAIKHSTAELVHCLKVISDNEIHAGKKLSKDKISKLIHNKIETINLVINDLTTLSDVIKHDNGMADNFGMFCTRWHFSQYQRHRLQQVLNRWACCYPEQNPFNVIGNSVTNSNHVLNILEEEMDACAIKFHV